MKNLVVIVILLNIAFLNAQVYEGKGDSKFQVGANFQDAATGINVSYDLGVGENISIGVSSTYALGIDEDLDADFGDRFDVRARFNANLGNVINIDDNFDVYPGLSLGINNFGGHFGMRYLISDGFGLYTELNTPLAKYNTDTLTPAETIHNQFTVNLGALFNF